MTELKDGEQEPIEVEDGEEDNNEVGKIEGGADMTIDDQAIAENKQQLEKSVQDTQMSSTDPPHVISASTETVIVKDVSNPTNQNINPLIEEEYLKRILFQSTLQTKLCGNHVLVSVHEIQKSESMIVGEEVKTQETTTVTPQVTSVQPSQLVVIYQRMETVGCTVSTPIERTPVSLNVQEPKKRQGCDSWRR